MRSTTPRYRSARMVVGTLGVMAALAIAGCGGDEAASSDSIATIDAGAADAPPASTDDGSGDTTFREAILDYAACMREQGIDFPDPQFDADGNIMFGDGGAGPGGGGAAQDDPGFEDAQQACEGLLEGIQDGFQPDPEQQAELRDSLLEFAECMRDQGVDFADPQFDADGNLQLGELGGGGPGGPGAQLDDPAFEAAAEVCQDALGDIGGPGGLIGGGNG